MGSTLIFQQTHERANPDLVGHSVWIPKCILPNPDRWTIPVPVDGLYRSLRFSRPCPDKWTIPDSVYVFCMYTTISLPCPDKQTIPDFVNKLNGLDAHFSANPREGQSRLCRLLCMESRMHPAES